MIQTQPDLQPQPLRSITLTEEQSQQLNQAAGPDSWGSKFVVASRCAHPGDPLRWRLVVIESTARKVNAAIKKLATPHKPSS